ncbi:NAD(P)H-quinone oxidoreductase [Thalassotalea sp. LPB0316]|uniref:NAD(P)H-quinone oxidoreductase n=1 Tax=Thalassotalea sp. LPB0316 TaxID=2769490 RepID=UPI001866849F|nr:NAD(P)H-quinone oxidoreductase [Thalassotalea sp. LPB0316]QOL24936.1 NAD(P)H-quinone oxidoreductase [Thalassotalea sp. LPB0316]
MRYLQVNPDQSLSFAECSTPAYAAHECLIKVSAFGVNRADLLQKQGKYPPPKGASNILGLEACGEVVSIGGKVDNLKVGDKVMALLSGGGYAEYVNVDARHVLPLPKVFSIEQGAGFMETFVTAYQALVDIGQLTSGQTVLVHAGASGVGTAVIALAKALNCSVVATASTAKKCNNCKIIGADLAINYKKEDFVEVCKNKKLFFDVVVDVVAGDYLNRNIQLMNLDGKIVILSMLGGRYAESIDIAKLLQKRVSIHASTLRNRSDDYKAELVSRFYQQFGSKLADQNSELTPFISKVFPWHNAEQAHQLLADNLTTGKVILKIAGEA